jgi:hypothetical protein
MELIRAGLLLGRLCQIWDPCRWRRFDLAFESIFERVIVPVGFGISLSAGMARSFVVCCFIVFVDLR